MLEVTAVELLGQSRKIDIDPNNVSQTMKFGLHGNFIEEAGDSNDVWITNDDQKVLEYVYQNFPWFREFLRSDGTYGILFLTAGHIDATDDSSVWILELTYDIPDSSNSTLGQGQFDDLIQQYGMGPGGGENGGNDWSAEFTQLSFNSTAETKHVTSSLQIMEIQKAEGLPATISLPTGFLDKPGSIGAHDEGIEGTDIYDREFKFQITQYFSPQRLKYRYIRRLYLLTATVNIATFFGFPAGSVLFLGASGSGTLVENVPITFDFAVKPNFKFITGSSQPTDTSPSSSRTASTIS